MKLYHPFYLCFQMNMCLGGSRKMGTRNTWSVCEFHHTVYFFQFSLWLLITTPVYFAFCQHAIWITDVSYISKSKHFHTVSFPSDECLQQISSVVTMPKPVTPISQRLKKICNNNKKKKSIVSDDPLVHHEDFSKLYSDIYLLPFRRHRCRFCYTHFHTDC